MSGNESLCVQIDVTSSFSAVSVHFGTSVFWPERNTKTKKIFWSDYWEEKICSEVSPDWPEEKPVSQSQSDMFRNLVKGLYSFNILGHLLQFHRTFAVHIGHFG